MPAPDDKPDDTATPPSAGEMRIDDGLIQHYVPPTPGGWEVMPLFPPPLSFNIRSGGVWYVSRRIDGIWWAEEHDMVSMQRMGREEREVAKALLRCALTRLEEME